MIDPAEYRRLIDAAKKAVEARARRPAEAIEEWAARLAADIAELND